MTKDMYVMEIEDLWARLENFVDNVHGATTQEVEDMMELPEYTLMQEWESELTDDEKEMVIDKVFEFEDNPITLLQDEIDEVADWLDQYDNEIIDFEILEEIEENEYVKHVDNLGTSGYIEGYLWYAITLIDGREYGVYVK